MDISLYIKYLYKLLLVVILYIDDLIILASDVVKLKWFKLKLENKFKMNDLGELYYCFGMEFGRNREAHIIIMNERLYIKKVLNYFNIRKCKSVGTPSDVNSRLLRLSEQEFGNVKGEMEGNSYKMAVR